MSFAALAWAGQVDPGSASRKLVLFGLADRHNEEADGAYPSIGWLSGFTCLNRKTIISALAALEADGFISDSGERVGSTRQVKVYRLHIEAVPKSEQYRNRNGSEKGGKGSRKRDTEPVKEPIPPMRLTPHSPPEGADAGEAILHSSSVRGRECASADTPGLPVPEVVAAPPPEPPPPPPPPVPAASAKGRERQRGERIAADWEPPPIDDLPPRAREIARQWPPGAYAAQAEAFRCYWRGEGRAGARKLDWVQAWCNRIVSLGARPIADARSGLRLSDAAAEPRYAAEAPADPERVARIAALRDGEGEGEARLRRALRGRIGSKLYEQWFGGCALRLGDALEVCAASGFAADWITRQFGEALAAVAVEVGERAVPVRCLVVAGGGGADRESVA